jgi:hypothetical protein
LGREWNTNTMSMKGNMIVVVLVKVIGRKW